MHTHANTLTHEHTHKWQLGYVPALRLTHEDWDMVTLHKSLLDDTGGLTLKAFQQVTHTHTHPHTHPHTHTHTHTHTH